MKRNVCGLDRVARVVVGVGLVFLGSRLRRSRRRRVHRLGTAGLAYGVELLATATVQWCPTNAALGVNTCEQRVPEAIRAAVDRLMPDGDRDGRVVPISTPT